MAKLFNRAQMTTATTGTGTITLGSASSGYRTFAAAGVVNADVVYYTIVDGTAWEIGTGTYTSAGTLLSRTLLSSSTGSLLSLSGSAIVFVTAPAEGIANKTEPNTFTANNTVTGLLSVGDGTTFTGFRLAAAAGTSRYVQIRTGASSRWEIGADSAAESGSNAGSGFAINRYNDSGTYVDTPIFITRSNGEVLIGTYLASGTEVGAAIGSSQYLVINGSAATSRSIFYQTAGVDRFRTRITSTAESGSSVGSDFSIDSYDDAGTLIASPLTITRSTGRTTLTQLAVSGYIVSGVDVGTNDGTYTSLDLNGSAAQSRMLRYRTAGVNRWEIGADNAAESGSNAGSNYDINRYDDAGSYIDTPLTIRRNDGSVYIPFIDPATSFGISTSTSAFVKLNAATATQRMFQWQTAASNRWLFGTDNSTEAGADAGCDIVMYSYADAGTFKEQVMKVTRSTGATLLKELNLTNDLTVPNGGTGVGTLTGIVKGNGTSAFSAATAGTDYVIPSGTVATATNQSGGTVNATNVTYSGVMTIPSGGGTNYMKAGTGDGASFTTYNLKINAWWGIGFGDYTDASTVKAYLDTRSGHLGLSGALGVGTAASATAGEIRATNNITAYYSDERLKTEIKPIPDALKKVCRISGVTFVSNELAAGFGYTSKKVQVGVIAQEIEAVLPEVVVPAPFDIAKNEDGTEYSKSGENYKTVQYDKLVPLLIEAIKELSSKVDSMNIELEALRAK